MEIDELKLVEKGLMNQDISEAASICSYRSRALEKNLQQVGHCRALWIGKVAGSKET